MSNSFETGGILGSARPVIFGACFRPSLFRICSLIASKLIARISSCILQVLQALPAIARCRTWALSMPGASKAPRRTSESNSSALVTILFKVTLGRIKLYDRPSSQKERSDNQWHRPTHQLLVFPSDKILEFFLIFLNKTVLR